MSDYSKSVIYMIKKKDDDNIENVYVGSTKDFMKRKHSHKKSCNNPNSKGYNIKLYQYIRNNGGWDEWIMVVIQDYPCDSREELEEREDQIMCEIKSKLNNNRANRSWKEYKIDNKEKVLEKQKEYRELNKEKVKEKHKKYCENNKEKITEQMKKYYENNKYKILERVKDYYKQNKDNSLKYQKQYQLNNKDKNKEYQKEYYELNKQKIKEQVAEKIKCDKCGSEINRGNLVRHKKSLKCQNFVH